MNKLENQGGLNKAARIPVFMALALSVVLLSFIQCGYRLRGTGNLRDVLPSHVKKIGIPLFKNHTTRFELDKKFTQGVIDEFVARGKVEVIPDVKAADAVLAGEILDFRVYPVAFSGQGQATADHYAVYVAARIVLTDQKNQKVIYSNPSYSFTEEYEVPKGKDFESVETEALRKIADKFARNLVVTILEGF